jgi:hypothetical protein
MAPPAEGRRIAAILRIGIPFSFAYSWRGGREALGNLAQKRILRNF